MITREKIPFIILFLIKVTEELSNNEQSVREEISLKWKITQKRFSV